MAGLVTGILVEGAVLIGLAVNFELLVIAASLAAGHQWLRRVTVMGDLPHQERGVRGAFALPAIGILLTGVLLLTAPGHVLRLLASGTDNAAWLFVSAQFASQEPIWSGHGGSMTVALAFATGVGRLVAVAVGGSSSSVVVPIAAVTFLTLCALGASVPLVRKVRGQTLAALALVVTLGAGSLALLDFGHLSALLVVLLVAVCVVGFERVDHWEQITLLWVAVLALTLWFPVKPLAFFGSLAVLVFMNKVRRTHGLRRGLLVIDAMVIVPPLMLAVRFLLTTITPVGAAASGLITVSFRGVFDGVAQYLARTGGTHSVPLFSTVAVLALACWVARRERCDVRPPTIGLLALAGWAVTLRLIDQIANGQSGYGSQKLILVVTVLLVVWIVVNSRRAIPVGLSVLILVVSLAISAFRIHFSTDTPLSAPDSASWMTVLENDLSDELTALPKGCVTDPDWGQFDDPVADDRAVWSSFTCTRFLGSLAGRLDLPRDLLEFNVGHETWGWLVDRATKSPFLLDEVLVLDATRVPYRSPRLIDYVAETASVRTLAVETRSTQPDVVGSDPPIHSIDEVDVSRGMLTGWAGSTVDSLVLVSSDFSDGTLTSVSLSPRPDVELAFGVRELASGVRVDFPVPASGSLCVLVRDSGGNYHLANSPGAC